MPAAFKCQHAAGTSSKLSRNVRKRTFGHVRPAKIQISLRICAGWSESSLGALWIAKDAKYLYADSEAADAPADLLIYRR